MWKLVRSHPAPFTAGSQLRAEGENREAATGHHC